MDAQSITLLSIYTGLVGYGLLSAFFVISLVRHITERDAVVRALAHCQSNLAKTSRLLGISRPTLYNLLKKFQLDGHAEPQGLE